MDLQQRKVLARSIESNIFQLSTALSNSVCFVSYNVSPMKSYRAVKEKFNPSCLSLYVLGQLYHITERQNAGK